MLSIEECRELIGDPDLTDEEILSIRDDHYAMACLALESYHRSKKPTKT